MAFRPRDALGALAVLVLAAGCSGELARALRPPTPREQYVEVLRSAGLADMALYLDWQAAAARALDSAPLLETPFEESGYLAPGLPDARGFRFAVRRGQRISATFSLTGLKAAPLFADLFEISGAEPPRRRSSADSGATTLSAEIRRDGEVVLRLQPELLAGGRYRVTVHLSPVLGFPVGGAAQDAIRSRFGAERDAGRRRHEGVDIFAPRGTPVLAAEGGVATWVGENRLGGTVIMIRDRERGENHYYAHLDSQLVRENEVVERGDTIGLVGNTGNARTTPPHLHFGIYDRGAVDPWPYVAGPDTVPPPLAVAAESLGEWIRVARAAAPLVSRPGGDSLRTLEPRTILRALGGIGRWYRVRLPDGMEGFVDGDRIEPLAALGGADDGGELLEAPLRGSAAMASAAAGQRVVVLGRFGEFDLVRMGGRAGWMAR